MKILVLGSEIPATPNMPGSPRLFSLCRLLARRHELTLAAFNQDEERYRTFQADPMVPGVFEAITVLPAPPPPSWWGRQAHRIRQEASFVTRSRTPRYFRAQEQRIRSLIREGGFDVVFADGLPVSQYLIDSKVGRPAIIDLHDCFTLLFRRTMEAETRWLRKLALYAESRSIARLERSLGRAFSTVIVNSAVDEAFLRDLDPGAETLTIGNGVDGEFFSASDIEADPMRLVFTGVMDYGPNEDAAIFFAEEVFPLVRARHPKAQFDIVGKSPTERVLALAAAEGVRVTGGVPDVRPYLSSAGIFVCPLRFGAGVKNKLLAALSMRKGVVATPISVEGLELRDGKDLLIADEAEDFASKVIGLLEDPGRARQLGGQGQKTVRAKYSWEGSATLLEATLRQAIGASVKD